MAQPTYNQATVDAKIPKLSAWRYSATYTSSFDSWTTTDNSLVWVGGFAKDAPDVGDTVYILDNVTAKPWCIAIITAHDAGNSTVMPFASLFRAGEGLIHDGVTGAYRVMADPNVFNFSEMGTLQLITQSEYVEGGTLPVNSQAIPMARLSAVEGKIPAEATPANQLADKSYVMQQISGMEGQTYVVASHAALLEVTGMVSNDSALVQVDETHDGGTTFYKYTGSAWEYVFTINTTPLSNAQIAAIDSGITAAKVASYDAWLGATLAQILANSGDAGQKSITNLYEFDVKNIAGQTTFAYSGGNDEFTMSNLARGNLRQWVGSYLNINEYTPGLNGAMATMGEKPKFVAVCGEGISEYGAGQILLAASGMVAGDALYILYDFNGREWLTVRKYVYALQTGWGLDKVITQTGDGTVVWGDPAGTPVSLQDMLYVEVAPNAYVTYFANETTPWTAQNDNGEAAFVYIHGSQIYVRENSGQATEILPAGSSIAAASTATTDLTARNFYCPNGWSDAPPSAIATAGIVQYIPMSFRTPSLSTHAGAIQFFIPDGSAYQIFVRHAAIYELGYGSESWGGWSLVGDASSKVPISTSNSELQQSTLIQPTATQVYMYQKNGSSNVTFKVMASDITASFNTARTLSNESLLTKADVDAMLAPLGWS
jgi:hypothetical protein